MSITPYNRFTVRDLSNVQQPYVNSSSESGYFSGGNLGTIANGLWRSLPAVLNTNNGIASLDASGLRILNPGIYSINLSLFPTTTQVGSSNISFNFGTRYLYNDPSTNIVNAFGGPRPTGMFTYDPSNNPYSPGIISWVANGYDSSNNTISNFIKNPITSELSYNYFNAGYPNGGALYSGICTTKMTFILGSSASIFLNILSNSTTGVTMGNCSFTLNLISYLPVFPFPLPVKTWNWTRSSLGSKYTASVTSSSDGSQIFVGTNLGIYSSLNSGTTWSSTILLNSDKGNWTCLASNSNSTNLVGGTGNGIYYSSDLNHTTWGTASGAPAGSWRAMVSSAVGTKLAAAYFNGSIYTSSNSGATWTTNSNSSGIKSWTGIASDSTCTNLAATADTEYIYYSTDSGLNWINRSGSSGIYSWNCITSDSNGQYLAAGTNSQGIYYSINSGVSWSKSDASDGLNFQNIASSSDGSKLLAVVNGGIIYASSNYGVNWSPANNNLSFAWQDVVLSSDGLKAVAVNGSFTVDAVYTGIYS